MDKRVEVQEGITLLSFMISTVSLFISYTNFRAIVATQDYSTYLVLSLLMLTFVTTVTYGVYLSIKLIKTWPRSQ